MLSENPFCEIKSPICTNYAQALDEALKRSAGGAIIEGELAKQQGQVFRPACNACNGFKEDNPRWAVENGMTISRYAKYQDATE